MPDTGFKFPTTNGTPNNDWTDPTNAYSDDGLFTTRLSDGIDYKKQSYGTFTLGLPTAAGIVGIDVRAKGKVDAGTGDLYVVLVRSGTEIYSKTATLTTTSTEHTLGGATDVWGGTFTGANMTDAILTITIHSDAIVGKTYSVDYVKIKVYYTDDSSNFFNFFF